MNWIWIIVVLGAVGVGVYSSIFGWGLPSGCVSEPPTPITLNGTAQGEITTFHTYRLYELAITSQTQVSIAASSTYDNYLELYLGESDQAMLQNDDGGNGFNALISTTLAPGMYYILIRPFSDGTGPFTLTVTGTPVGAPQ